MGLTCWLGSSEAVLGFFGMGGIRGKPGARKDEDGHKGHEGHEADKTRGKDLGEALAEGCRAADGDKGQDEGEHADGV